MVHTPYTLFVIGYIKVKESNTIPTEITKSFETNSEITAYELFAIFMNVTESLSICSEFSVLPVSEQTLDSAAASSSK
jgi:hypothetical protein